MITPLRPLLALVLLASPALASSYDGTWAPNAAACTASYPEDRLTISGESIRFVESSCALKAPTALRDMPQATLFDMQCSGEGMTWSERVFLATQGEAGLLLYTRGHGRQYIRC